MYMFPLGLSNLLGAELDGHSGQRERSPGIDAVCHGRIDFTGLVCLVWWFKDALSTGLLACVKSRLFPRERIVQNATLTSEKRKVWLQPAVRHQRSFSEAVGGGGGRVGSPLTQHAGSQPRNRFIHLGPAWTGRTCTRCQSFQFDHGFIGACALNSLSNLSRNLFDTKGSKDVAA